MTSARRSTSSPRSRRASTSSSTCGARSAVGCTRTSAIRTTAGSTSCTTPTVRAGAVRRTDLMERKKASEFPQGLLDLFQLYVHGEIDRGAFLQRAAVYAAGGVTAAGLLEMLKPNYAWAQQVAKDDPRIRTS